MLGGGDLRPIRTSETTDGGISLLVAQRRALPASSQRRRNKVTTEDRSTNHLVIGRIMGQRKMVVNSRISKKAIDGGNGSGMVALLGNKEQENDIACSKSGNV